MIASVSKPAPKPLGASGAFANEQDGIAYRTVLQLTPNPDFAKTKSRQAQVPVASLDSVC
jgi:hypothetical protein